MALIKNGELATSSFVDVSAAEAIPPTGAVIVSLDQWQAHRDALLARKTPLGIRMHSDQPPELIAAGALEIEAVAFSCVTNMAPGIIPGRAVNHDEVIEVMNASRERCAALLAAVLEKLESRSPDAVAAED